MKKQYKQCLFLLKIQFSILGISTVVGAQSGPQLDSASSEALTKTQDVLTDPNARKDALKNDAKAREADSRVKSIAGDKSEDVYALASSIFGKLVAEAGGDPLKLQQLIEKAQKNPEAFGSSLSPDDRQKLKELARQLESRGPSGTPP